jgi:transposase-like protein
MAKLARQQTAALDDRLESLELMVDFGKAFWNDVANQVTRLVKQLIERYLEQQRTDILSATSYQRTPARTGYRGGTYPRTIKTKWGEVKVRVPRLEEGTMDLEIVDRYGHRQVEVDQLIGRLFLAGCSTRHLHDLSEQIYGWEVGRSTVSEITKALDAEVAAYRNQPIPDTIKYLLLDGIHAKVRDVGAVGKVFLVAYGIHHDGRREILGFVLADSESAANWREVLADLKVRGLRGRCLKLITVDGNKGLLKALKDIYPLTPVQRCVMHKIRNVMAACSRVRNKKAIAASLRPIWVATNRRQALRAIAAFEAQWMVEEERAVRTLTRDIADCLRFLDLPTQDHKKIRTTNALERAFREVRRRTRPMGTFVSKDSAERIMFGITDTMNQRWSGVPQLAKSAE